MCRSCFGGIKAPPLPAPCRARRPAGMDDSGGVGPDEEDWTIFTTLRDHTNARYYYRWGRGGRL